MKISIDKKGKMRTREGQNKRGKRRDGRRRVRKRGRK